MNIEAQNAPCIAIFHQHNEPVTLECRTNHRDLYYGVVVGVCVRVGTFLNINVPPQSHIPATQLEI